MDSQNMKLFTVIFVARAIQLVAMAGCSSQLIRVARGKQLKGRPRLSIWFWRTGAALAVFAACLTLATFWDAFEWLRIIWASAAINALFWLVLDIHLRLTRKAARRAQPETQGKVLAGVDDLLNEMERAKAKANRQIAKLHRL
jgi:hypothetical protein